MSVVVSYSFQLRNCSRNRNHLHGEQVNIAVLKPESNRRAYHASKLIRLKPASAQDSSSTLLLLTKTQACCT